jgi:hypothetical protein
MRLQRLHGDEPLRATVDIRMMLGQRLALGFHRKELGYLKPLIRRSFLDHHGLRYDEGLRLGEDYALYARALAAGARFLLVPTAGYVAVERADSLSARHNRRDLEALRNSDRELMATNLTPSGGTSSQVLTGLTRLPARARRRAASMGTRRDS